MSRELEETGRRFGKSRQMEARETAEKIRALVEESPLDVEVLGPWSSQDGTATMLLTETDGRHFYVEVKRPLD